MSDGAEICVSVLVEDVREFDGSQGTMALVVVKDSHAEVDMVVFSKVYTECKELLFWMSQYG